MNFTSQTYRKILISALAFATLLLSCQKEPRIPPVSEQANTDLSTVESINPAFNQTTLRMENHISGIGAYSRCSYDGIVTDCKWSIDYRLGTAVRADNKVMYPIEKKWHVTYDCSNYNGGIVQNVIKKWNKDAEWHNSGKYYRYDFAGQKAYRYNAIDDSDPDILMDFSLNEGDLIVLDYTYGIKFQIVLKKTITSNGQSYPVYSGHYIFGSGLNWEHHYFNPMTNLSPFNPNPFHMMDNFHKVQNHYWSAFQQTPNEQEPAHWISDDLHNNVFDYDFFGIIPVVDSTLGITTHTASFYY